MSLFPRSILPVLMYHRFGDRPVGDPSLWISPDRFAGQLAWLRESGFRTLSLDEAYTAQTQGPVPRRSVLLTIDDGFAEDLEIAAALLEKTGACATVFVAAGLLGQEVELRHPSGHLDRVSTGPIVDTDGLHRWIRKGFDVGSHSLTHLDLTTCTPEVAQREISESRARLEATLEREIVDFCYPFAHHDSATRQAVKAAGYRAGYAGEPPVDDILAIPRMMVYPGDSAARFRRKVSGYYFWISALHQNLRRFVGN
jgi:peptidoglycan/xylan/chitin deacetylase (PgdA/CDA1 family)